MRNNPTRFYSGKEYQSADLSLKDDCQQSHPGSYSAPSIETLHACIWMSKCNGNDTDAEISGGNTNKIFEKFAQFRTTLHFHLLN